MKIVFLNVNGQYPKQHTITYSVLSPEQSKSVLYCKTISCNENLMSDTQGLKHDKSHNCKMFPYCMLSMGSQVKELYYFKQRTSYIYDITARVYY
jgi:hypothetical protein